MPNKHNNQPPASKGGLSKYWPAFLLVMVMTVIAAALISKSEGKNASDSGQAASATASQSISAGFSDTGSPLTAMQDTSKLSPAQRAAQILELQKRVEAAEQALASYRNSTKYPLESRPISEQPDQVYPNRPVEESRILRKANGTFDADVNVKTSQTRVFVANQESVVFTITAIDKSGKALPVFVNRAIARGIVATGQRASAQITLPFSDDGSSPDALAGDGIYSTVLTPSATGLANFNGTIRVDVNFNVGDSPGVLFFDIIYTPETPASFTGEIRDVQEAGSLNFYLKANVNQAGRYLINGRVDDASGKPFALVSFNDTLQTGRQEIKLSLFGKLLSDQAPVFPLTLRDVDGFLLKENADPDRALIPRLIGSVHTTKKYAAASFSTAEAESEQRTRYLEELAKDVNLAKTALDQLKK